MNSLPLLRCINTIASAHNVYYVKLLAGAAKRLAARLLYDQVIAHHDFAGPWTGWRMRGDRLKGPGVTVRPETMRAFARWVNEAAQQPSSLCNESGGRPRLYLAYTRPHEP